MELACMLSSTIGIISCSYSLPKGFFDNFRGRPKSATGYKNKVHRWDEMHIELINHETFIFLIFNSFMLLSIILLP